MDVKSKLVICFKFDDDPVNPKEKKLHMHIKKYIVFWDIILWFSKTKNLLYTKNLEIYLFIYAH